MKNSENSTKISSCCLMWLMWLKFSIIIIVKIHSITYIYIYIYIYIESNMDDQFVNRAIYRKYKQTKRISKFMPKK